MKTLKWTEAKAQPNPHEVDARLLHTSEHALVVHLRLDPGQSLIRHITPVDVVFYVLAGRGTVLVGEETREVEAGTLVESPAHIVHNWSNTGDEELRVLVVKTPRPTKKTKLL